MPTVTEPTTQAGQPADIAAHEADKARRAKERESKRETLRDCLDSKTAAQHEAKKPLYTFEVCCEYTRPNAKGRLIDQQATHKVTAQNEADAWAMWCDLQGVWPSPSNCERTITRKSK